MRSAASRRSAARDLAWGVAIALWFGVLAIAAPWIAAHGSPVVPYDPASIDLEHVLEPPSRDHWLGTDGLGRDVASRLIHGTRVSISVGLMTALVALAIGVPLGAIGGTIGGLWDAVLTRVSEAVMSFPAIVLVLALLAVEPPGLQGLGRTARIAVILGLTAWVPVARYVRAETARTSRLGFVEAARASGAGPTRVLLRHVLPSAFAPVAVTGAFAVAGAVAVEAALSFLGLGVQPPTPSWGSLLQESRAHLGRAWWLAVFPGGALALLLLGCSLLGEGLRDRFDPRGTANP